MTTLIQGPMLTNPDTLTTIDELRCELHRTNIVVMQQFSALAQLHQSGHQAAMALEAILRSHLAEGIEAVIAHLESYLFRHPRLREHLEDQIESERLRRVH